MEKTAVSSAVKTYLSSGNNEEFSRVVQGAATEENADTLADYASSTIATLGQLDVSVSSHEILLDILGFVDLTASASFDFRVQKGKQYLQTATFPKLEQKVSAWHSFDPNKDTWVMPLPNHVIRWDNGCYPGYPERDSPQYSLIFEPYAEAYPREEGEWYEAKDRIESLEALVKEKKLAENMEEFRDKWNYGFRHRRMEKRVVEFFSKALILPLLLEICSLLKKADSCNGQKGSKEWELRSFYCLLARERVIDLFEVSATFGTQFQLAEFDEDQINAALSQINPLKQRLIQISASAEDKVSNAPLLEISTGSVDIISGLEGMFRSRLAEIRQTETLKRIVSEIQELRTEVRAATQFMRSLQIEQAFANMHHMAGIRAVGELVDHQIRKSFFVEFGHPTFSKLLQNHLPRLH